MVNEIYRLYRFTVRNTVTAAKYLLKYRRTIAFIRRKRGLKAAFKFILVKLSVRGEESGIALLDPIWRIFPKLAFYPYMFEIEVTTKCHLRCVFCEHTHWSEKPRDLSFDDFKKVVDQFPGLIWINVTGEGTSFLNPEFMDMLRYLKSKSVFVAMVDSFDRIDEKEMKELIEIGVDKISLSIDGATKESYEEIRIGGNFDRVVENVRRFIRMKEEMDSPVPELCFRMVFTKTNYHEMIQFIDLVHSFGEKKYIGEGTYAEFVSLLEFEQTEDLIYEPAEEIVQKVNRRARELDIEVKWDHPSHEARKKPPMRKCIVWTEPYIMIGGDVVSCCAVLMSNNRTFLKKHSFGNVLEKPFKEIWYSDRYRQFRSLVGRDEGEVPILCAGCRAYDTTYREKRYGISSSI